MEGLRMASIGQDGILWYPKKEIYGLLTFPEIMPVLYEMNFLEKKNSIVEINPKYMHLMHGQNKITQKQLESRLLHQKTVGEIGEEIVLDFEKNRLKREGCLTEASKVNRISTEFATQDMT